jgi:Tfp pilus assembly protein PilV
MNAHTPNQRPNRRGFSLLEALITLVIMLLIIGGATALFFENQSATTAHIALAELRTNMRFAMETMSSDLRVVGAYTRWAPLQVLKGAYQFNIVECTNTQWQPFVSGLQLGHYAGYDSTIPDRIRVVEPDIINDAQLRDQYNPPSSQFKAVKISGEPFQQGDLLLITNAPVVDDPWAPGAQIFADLFVPTTIQGPQSGNPFTEFTFNAGSSDPYGVNDPQGFPQSYPPGSTIMRIRIWEYYIDTTIPDIPRLMRLEARPNAVPEEVSRYVEDIQVAMGIDADGDNNITGAEWVDTNFHLITNAQLQNLRAMRVTLIGRTFFMPEVMAGKRVGTNDIFYQRPAVEDRTAGTVSPLPQFREVYSEVIMFRNLRPAPQE